MNATPKTDQGVLRSVDKQISRQCSGHTSPITTHRYVEAKLAMTE